MQPTRKGELAMTQNNNHTEQWTKPIFNQITPTYESQQEYESLTPRAKAIRTILLTTAALITIPIILKVITKVLGTIQLNSFFVPLPAIVFIIAGILFGNKKE